jgi:hypothetical protein
MNTIDKAFNALYKAIENKKTNFSNASDFKLELFCKCGKCKKGVVINLGISNN